MIIVTGGAGFIGSNLVLELNRRGERDVLVVDDLSDGTKALNLSSATIADYLDREEARSLWDNRGTDSRSIDAVIHLGACTDTTEWDGRYMMSNNFAYSRLVFEFCCARSVPLVYASSAAVYGGGKKFSEIEQNESPLNVYGYSKLAFDQYVRVNLKRATAPVVGLRYFNVYGPREGHKGSMASVAWHWYQQATSEGRLKIFEGSHGFAAGEQRRDFVYVDDVVDVTLWAAAQSSSRISGIYNCGTGRAQTFNDVAQAIVRALPETVIEEIAFPPRLLAAYQAYTEADLKRLREAGYDRSFKDVATGVEEYIRWLDS